MVLGQDLCGEIFDPDFEGTLAQSCQQHGAEPTPLPGIDHGHCQIGGVGLVREADEPAFPDDLLLRLQRHGHQRLVIGVIDLDRRLDGGLGELGHNGEEPPVTGLLAQVRVGTYHG